MTKFIRGYNKLCDVIEYVFNLILSLMFAALVIVISLQIFSRFMDSALLWTVDVGVLLMIWFSLLGMAICVRRKILFTIHVFPEKWTKTTYALEVLSIICIFLLGAFFVVQGFQYVLETKNGVSGMAQIPLPITHLSLPISGMMVVLFSIELLINLIVKEGQ